MYQTFDYKGKLPDRQVYGKEKMEYEQDVYTPEQNRLYKESIRGYGAFSKEELQKFSRRKLATIRKRYAKSQRLINLYKQERLNKKLSCWMLPLFPKSDLAKEFCENTTHRGFECTLSFKDLGITKDEIVTLLYRNRILPENFYEL